MRALLDRLDLLPDSQLVLVVALVTLAVLGAVFGIPAIVVRYLRGKELRRRCRGEPRKAHAGYGLSTGTPPPTVEMRRRIGGAR